MSKDKLEVIGQIDSYEDAILSSVGVQKEEGIICLSLDKSVKVWVKRRNGQYWPSISYTLPSQAHVMEYMEACWRLYVGLEDGVVMEFQIAEDFNKLTLLRTYAGHLGRVTGVKRVEGEGEGGVEAHLVTSSTDRCVIWHGLEDGKMKSAYQHSIALTCVECDSQSSSIYAADKKGSILVLSHEPPSKTLRRRSCPKHHHGRITCMLAGEMGGKRVLMSGGDDGYVCVFQLPALTLLCRLLGHMSPIISIHHHPSSNHLLTSSQDSQLILWDMKAKRSPAAEWGVSDSCEECGTPFYWNLSSMWTLKTLGVRQHHCRVCGRALCRGCSDCCAPVPSIGFELPIRMCASCHGDVTRESQASLCSHHHLPSPPTHLHYESSKNILILSTKDRSIQIIKADIWE